MTTRFNERDNFPLEQWFDLSRPIEREDTELCEAQMALYAAKEDLPAAGPEWDGLVQSLRAAVKEHNAKIEKPN